MSNEQAAKYIRGLIGDGSVEFVYTPIKTEVLQMALDALECVKSQAFKDGYEKGVKDVMNTAQECLMIDCELCPFTNYCNDDCDKVFLRCMEANQ